MTPPVFTSRDPATMHPLLNPLWTMFMLRVRAAGMIPIATFFWRSKQDQDNLYLKGRRGIPGEKIVTNAQGGNSWHNVERGGMPASLAFDVCLMTPDGRKVLPDDDEAWERAAKIGEDLGLTCGIRWRMRDAPHYQLDSKGRLSLEDAMAGKDPEEGAA